MDLEFHSRSKIGKVSVGYYVEQRYAITLGLNYIVTRLKTLQSKLLGKTIKTIGLELKFLSNSLEAKGNLRL